MAPDRRESTRETCAVGLHERTTGSLPPTSAVAESSALQAVLDAHGGPVFSADRARRYTSFNTRHAELMMALFGWNIQLGQDLAAHQPVPEQWAQVLDLIDRALAGETVREESSLGAEAHSRWCFEMAYMPLRNQTNDIVGVCVHAQDITEQKRAEEALVVSEQRYHSIFSTMTEGFALHEIICNERGEPCDYRFIDVNPSFERLTGLRRSAVIGACMTELLPDEDREWVKRYGVVALTGEPTHFQDYSPALDRHFEVRAYCPAPRQFAVLFIDVTDRVRTQAQLAENREDLNRAQAVARTGSWRLDVRRNVLTWSDENHRIFGIPKGCPLTYESFLQIVHPDDREQVDREWKAGLGGHPYEVEHRIIVGGEVRWVRERAELELDSDGTLLGGFGTTQDITERRQVERALDAARVQALEEKNRIQAMMNALPVGVAILDERGGTILSNAMFDEIWGGPPPVKEVNDYTAYTAWWVDTGLAVEPQEWASAVAVSRGEAVLGQLLRIERFDGTKAFVLNGAVPVFDAEHRVSGCTVAIMDITELRQAQETATAALREKEVLLKEIHHRVKNNLQLVASMLSLQSASIKDPATREPLLESQHRIRTLALIHEKLYGSWDFTRVSFRPYLEELVAYLYKSYGGASAKITLRIDAADVSLDVGTAIPVALILNELLSNSFKHAFPEGREGHVTVTFRPLPDRRCELVVADDGIGLADKLGFAEEESMGMLIISVLTKQLDGVIELRATPGTCAVLTFGPIG